MNNEDQTLVAYFQLKYLEQAYPEEFATAQNSAEEVDAMVASHSEELADKMEQFQDWDGLKEMYDEETKPQFTAEDGVREVMAAKNGAKLKKIEKLHGCKCGCEMKTAKKGAKIKDTIEDMKEKGYGKKKPSGYKYLKKKRF